MKTHSSEKIQEKKIFFVYKGGIILFQIIKPR